MIERDNGNVHRAAAKIIVSKSRAARGSVCNVLLSRVRTPGEVIGVERNTRMALPVSVCLDGLGQKPDDQSVVPQLWSVWDLCLRLRLDEGI